MADPKVFPLETIRHTRAHLLAQAVQRYIDANVQLGTGPWTDTWFYYDMLFSESVEFGEKQLKELTKSVKQVAKEPQSFVFFECDIDDGYTINKLTNQTFKDELLDKFIAKGETKISYYLNVVPQAVLDNMRNTKDWYIEMYQWVTDFFRWKETITAEQGVVFLDLCAWPHVELTKEDLNAHGMKLNKLAGAYWQADEKNAQMTRIYGLAFEDKEALSSYEAMMEEAKKRDHRTLGQKHELFAFDDEVGPWLPLRLPNGAVIVEELERFAKETEEGYWYKRVRSPHIAKDKLYIRSWHLPYYEEDMFPPMELDNEKYYLKAMNCPHHHKIFGAFPKSYRDLPARYAEYGHCYRYEDSGSLFGLMRVRSLCMNDAHIYCTPEQFEEEFVKVIEMYLYYFKTFGIEKYEMRLSKHNKEWLWKKYVDNEALWIQTEEQVRKALVASGVPFVEAEWEAAFYGPKIDVQIWSAIWREFTLATNQLDFAVPERFNLTYTDQDGEAKTPICIHRAPLSTHERMVWFLIEEYAGAFPVWLSPVQARVIPVAETFNEYGQIVVQKLKEAWIRVEIDDSSDSFSKKIRNGEMMKVPYLLVIGQQEVDNQSVNARNFKSKDQKELALDVFVAQIVDEYKNRVI